jgi:signal transduction histidine kinase
MRASSYLFNRLTAPFRRSISAQIMTSYLLMVMLSLTVALAGIYYTNQANAKLVQLLEQDQRITSNIFTMQRAVERQNAAMRAYTLRDDEDLVKEINQAISDYDRANSSLRQELESVAISGDAYQNVNNFGNQFAEAVTTVRRINVVEFPTAAAYLWERSGPVVKDRLTLALDQLLTVYRGQSSQEINEARNQGGNVFMVAFLLVIMAALLGLFLSSVIARNVVAPLRDLAGVAREIKQGNLNVKVPIGRAADEVSDLAGAMGNMAVNLQAYRHEQETMLEDSRQRNRELSALNRVSVVLGQSLDLDVVLHDALDQLLKLADMEHGSIFLLDEDPNMLRLAAWHNQSDFYIRSYNRVQIGEQLTGYVARTGEVLVVAHPLDDPRLSNPNLKQETFKKFYLGVPLKSKGNVLGVVNMTSTTIRKLEPRDLEMYSAIGNQVGVAVDNARLYQQSAELAAVDERNRLARDLHDSVTQTLFSITLTAESIKAMLTKKPERVEGQVDRLQNLARSALAEMRSLIFQLRPAALQEQGLVAALDKHIAVMKAKDLYKVDFNVVGERRLSDEHEQTLYRIAQEAFNNINKHSQAKHVSIDLNFSDDEANLIIKDDGLGFDAETVLAQRNRASLGLTSMRERTELAGGSYTIESTPGNGTIVKVHLPLTYAPRPVGTGINQKEG